MSLETKRLGAAARSYIETALDSGKTLSKFVLRHHRLETGVAYADLPCGFTPDHLTDLSNGGIFSTDEASSFLVARIERFLASDPRALVVCEDQLARPTDPCMLESPTQMVAFGAELYHLLLSPESSALDVETTLAWQGSAGQELIFFSKPARPVRLSPQKEISESELDLVAQSTVEVCVSAFDGEGYVLWESEN